VICSEDLLRLTIRFGLELKIYTDVPIPTISMTPTIMATSFIRPFVFGAAGLVIRACSFPAGAIFLFALRRVDLLMRFNSPYDQSRLEYWQFRRIIEKSFRVKPYVEPAFLAILSGEIVLTAENDMYSCPNCNYEIDSCQCTCPYCAEIESCNCAIGHDKATGG
jgi:hypothetical protein